MTTDAEGVTTNPGAETVSSSNAGDFTTTATLPPSIHSGTAGPSSTEGLVNGVVTLNPTLESENQVRETTVGATLDIRTDAGTTVGTTLARGSPASSEEILTSSEDSSTTSTTPVASTGCACQTPEPTSDTGDIRLLFVDGETGNLPDLAFGKAANQSSTYGDDVAANVLDGAESTCSRTLAGPGAWWMVDLGTEATIHNVIVSDAQTGAFQVRVGSSFGSGAVISEEFSFCGNFQGTNSLNGTTVTCVGPMWGRYVAILPANSQDSTSVRLCEVRVQGQPIVQNALFKRKGQGVRSGDILKVANTRILSECGVLCLNHYGCGSFNVKPVGAGIRLLQCELVAGEKNTDELESSEQSDYYILVN
ncbi:uncharacterized protein LOC106155394 [Lingula anatina]|uniref:Uncharacterized protein LOC106155394 n=1 Tax=Lingula anatina TaxID=7574 RepID=A0A1S3HJM2_LINAN|nr:uncharacterized protein LOC106155394 [Lingula anatina]|eukprot:XP_013385651.1 uncharacterized protein LOC106155394 [Lingula anatina]